MSCVGFQEGLVIAFILAVVFGWGRLPQIGDGLGRAVRNFNRALKGENEVDVTPSKKLPEGEEREE